MILNHTYQDIEDQFSYKILLYINPKYKLYTQKNLLFSAINLFIKIEMLILFLFLRNNIL